MKCLSLAEVRGPSASAVSVESFVTAIASLFLSFSTVHLRPTLSLILRNPAGNEKGSLGLCEKFNGAASGVTQGGDPFRTSIVCKFRPRIKKEEKLMRMSESLPKERSYRFAFQLRIAI